MKRAYAINFSWLYLICGLVLTVAAIVLPSHQDLHELQQRQQAILMDLDDLHYRIEMYQSFHNDLQKADPELLQRIVAMQFNEPVSGTPVVIDRSASQTPLDWIEQRSRRAKRLNGERGQVSAIASLAQGRGRLWLAGGGVFAIFLGLIHVPTRGSEHKR